MSTASPLSRYNVTAGTISAQTGPLGGRTDQGELEYGWRAASATKSSIGESMVAWKYRRVAGAMRAYRLRTGPASSGGDFPDGVVTGVAPTGQAHLPAARALCTQDTGP